MELPPESEVSFATYFNAFPASYWRRWTVLDTVEYSLDLGPFEDGGWLWFDITTEDGWAVGAYRDDAAEEPESLHTTNDSTTPALLTLVRHTLCSVRQPWAQDRGR